MGTFATAEPPRTATATSVVANDPAAGRAGDVRDDRGLRMPAREADADSVVANDPARERRAGFRDDRRRADAGAAPTP